MRTNLSSSQLETVASLAKSIDLSIGNKNHPENYLAVNDLNIVRDFVHTLDLLETVLTHFEISVHLSKLALEKLENPEIVGSLGWEFWQIDIEEFFASNLLELCYQVSNAWKEIDSYRDKNDLFKLFKTGYKKPSDTLLARHKSTHFKPLDFQKHELSKKYSILRRPYIIKDGKLVKELAKGTMPKVAELIRAAVKEGTEYLQLFSDELID